MKDLRGEKLEEKSFENEDINKELEKEIGGLAKMVDDEIKSGLPSEEVSEPGITDKFSTADSGKEISEPEKSMPEKSKNSKIKDLLDKGKIHFNNGELDKALEIYQKVIEKNDKHLLGLFNLAVIYVRKNELDMAIDYFNRVLEIEPDDYKTLCNLGGIYYKKGQLKEAYDILMRAIVINPNDLYSLENIKLIEQKLPAEVIQ